MHRYLKAWIGLGVLLALVSGCAKKASDGLVTLPSAVLTAAGIAVKTLPLTASQARQIKFIRVQAEVNGKLQEALEQPVQPLAQTWYVVVWPQTSKEVKVILAVATEQTGGSSLNSAGMSFSVPLDDLTMMRSGGLVAFAPDSPRMVLSAGKGQASGGMEDPFNLVKIYVVEATSPGLGPGKRER